MLLLSFISLKPFAQSIDSLFSIYNTQTIYRSGNKFMKGNENLLYHELNIEFNSPISKQLYRKSRNRATISKVLNLTSLAVIIISAFTPTNTAGNIEFIAGTSILGLGGIYYHDQSSKYLDKAIWLRNREVLFGTNR